MLLMRWMVSRVAMLAATACGWMPAQSWPPRFWSAWRRVGPRPAAACPFCAAVSLTFCEEIDGADVAVIAKLVTPAPPVSADNPGDIGKARFEVVER